MKVSELIERLQQLPPYYEVLADVRGRYDETVCDAQLRNPKDMELGPHIVLNTTEDRRNHDEAY